MESHFKLYKSIKTQQWASSFNSSAHKLRLIFLKLYLHVVWVHPEKKSRFKEAMIFWYRQKCKIIFFINLFLFFQVISLPKKQKYKLDSTCKHLYSFLDALFSSSESCGSTLFLDFVALLPTFSLPSSFHPHFLYCIPQYSFSLQLPCSLLTLPSRVLPSFNLYLRQCLLLRFHPSSLPSLVGSVSAPDIPN